MILFSALFELSEKWLGFNDVEFGCRTESDDWFVLREIERKKKKDWKSSPKWKSSIGLQMRGTTVDITSRCELCGLSNLREANTSSCDLTQKPKVLLTDSSEEHWVCAFLFIVKTWWSTYAIVLNDKEGFELRLRENILSFDNVMGKHVSKY